MCFGAWCNLLQVDSAERDASWQSELAANILLRVQTETLGEPASSKSCGSLDGGGDG
jgi:hypothetical protein